MEQNYLKPYSNIHWNLGSRDTVWSGSKTGVIMSRVIPTWLRERQLLNKCHEVNTPVKAYKVWMFKWIKYFTWNTKLTPAKIMIQQSPIDDIPWVVATWDFVLPLLTPRSLPIIHASLGCCKRSLDILSTDISCTFDRECLDLDFDDWSILRLNAARTWTDTNSISW